MSCCVHGQFVGQGGDDAEREVGVAGGGGIERPVDRGAQVVELDAQPGPPGELVDAVQARSQLLGDRGVVLRVASSPSVGVAGLVEALAGVGT